MTLLKKDWEFILQALAEPFPVDEIQFRIGNVVRNKVQPLTYIDARQVMDRLDKVVGCENWQTHFFVHEISGKSTVFCALTIHDVTKIDAAGATDYEAEKGAVSDALKRAAVQWGINRVAYGWKLPFVEYEQRGKTKFLSDRTVEYLRNYIRKTYFGEEVEAEEEKAYTTTELKQFVRNLPNVSFDTEQGIDDFLADRETRHILSNLDDAWFFSVARYLVKELGKFYPNNSKSYSFEMIKEKLEMHGFGLPDYEAVMEI
jgi:hypothetical protein